MSGFINQLKAEIDKKHLLDHPFYQLWANGGLPLESMHRYAEQYFHLERHFPIFLSLMHSGCDEFTVRQMITDNMYDEEHGPKNHRELWLRFGEGIGTTREAIINSEMLPETKETIDSFKAMCSESFLAGAGCLGAYESQIPAVAESKMHGLKKHYNISDEKTTEFFSLHHDLDKKHAQSWWDIIEQHATTPQKQEEVMKAVINGRDALWGFLDGVTKAHVPEQLVRC